MASTNNFQIISDFNKELIPEKRQIFALLLHPYFESDIDRNNLATNDNVIDLQNYLRRQIIRENVDKLYHLFQNTVDEMVEPVNILSKYVNNNQPPVRTVTERKDRIRLLFIIKLNKELRGNMRKDFIDSLKIENKIIAHTLNNKPDDYYSFNKYVTLYLRIMTKTKYEGEPERFVKDLHGFVKDLSSLKNIKELMEKTLADLANVC